MEEHDLLAAIHAAFACVAVLFLIPAAILTARFKRSSEPPWAWVRTHMLLNVAGLLCIAVAFGLGIGAVLVEGDGYQFGGDDTDLHHQLGLALFILVSAQVALGFGMRLVKAKVHDGGAPGSTTATAPAGGSLGEKHWTRWIHMVLGAVVLGMLYWQSWDGLHNEWPNMSEEGTEAPLVVQVLFWVILLLPFGPYFIHLASATCRVIRADPPVTHDVDGEAGARASARAGVDPSGTPKVRPVSTSNPNPFEGNGGSTPESAAEHAHDHANAKVAFRLPSLAGSKARPGSTGDSIPMTEAQAIAADAVRRPALKFKERPV